MKTLLKKSFMLPLIVVVAITGVVYKVKTKPAIEHEDSQYPVKMVKVIEAKRLPFRSQATAYGYVSPAVSLKVKSEVSGKISYINPDLKKGASLSRGTVVLRIEPTKFEFSLDENKALMSGTKHNLEQLIAEEKSTLRSLKIAKQNLKIGQEELKRLVSIEKGLVAQSLIDDEQQKVLQLRLQVEDLESKMVSYKSKKSAIKSQIRQSEIKLKESEDTFNRTEIVLPFDARIGEVQVNQDEYIGSGTLLFEAHDTDSVEITAQLPVNQFNSLILGIGVEGMKIDQANEVEKRFKSADLQANVSLVGHNKNDAKWDGELTYISESVNSSKDTIDLIVQVNDPYKGVVPGKRPPLLKGMFAAVDFFAPVKHKMVIPRKALHQGRVYIADQNNTLLIKKVEIASKQNALAVIESGINEGERIIINDIIPVIEGLPLDVIHDSDYEKEIAIKSLGRTKETGVVKKLNSINKKLAFNAVSVDEE